MSFSLPKFSDQYCAKIVERTFNLIQCRIWSDLEPSALKGWLSNFSTPEEKYLGACLLDALIYRSEPQTIALAKQVFQRSLPDLLRRSPPSRPLPPDWYARLTTADADPGIRISGVMRLRDPIHKSASAITRALRRHLRVDERWIESPVQLARTRPSVVVFVDDFVGTGYQFEDFFTGSEQLAGLRDTYFVYAPLAAHDTGIAHLRERVPDVHLITADRLPADASLFQRGPYGLDDGLNSPEDAEAFYYDFLEKVHIRLSGDLRLGYGGLGLAYAFHHSVPDHTLPIFWWADSEHFQPLLLGR